MNETPTGNARPAPTTYRVGDDNIQPFGLDVHNPVFVIAAVVVIVFVAFTLMFSDVAATTFGALRPWLTTTFDWVFMITANVLVLVCLGIIVSPWGRLRIGGADARPEFNTLSWFAMLFAAGMGIGIMFYGVLEPVNHLLKPPLGQAGAGTAAAHDIALAATIMHWALHPWAIYAIMGLALAFFRFNKRLPLSIRSAFHPLLGDRVWGWPGHLIDVLAVFATLFGLATSLGYGAQQSAAGLGYLFGAQDGVTLRVAVIVAITIVALFSVMRGIDGGVKRLSELNIVLATLLLLFAALTGPTLSILANIGTNTISYLEFLPALSNWVGRDDGYFLHDWTTFYWAWWIAWSPFVGMFIARVSKGRTVRTFLISVLLVPSFVCVVWMTVFGGSAIQFYLETGATNVVDVVQNWRPELAMYRFLEQLPLTQLTSTVAVTLVMVFFVTSMDSGSLVVDTITAGGKLNTPVVQRIFWCLFTGLIATALMIGGGLNSLQALCLATGFPFAFVLLAMTFSLCRGLHREWQRLPR